MVPALKWRGRRLTETSGESWISVRGKAKQEELVGAPGVGFPGQLPGR